MWIVIPFPTATPNGIHINLVSSIQHLILDFCENRRYIICLLTSLRKRKMGILILAFEESRTSEPLYLNILVCLQPLFSPLLKYEQSPTSSMCTNPIVVFGYSPTAPDMRAFVKLSI